MASSVPPTAAPQSSSPSAPGQIFNFKAVLQ